MAVLENRLLAYIIIVGVLFGPVVTPIIVVAMVLNTLTQHVMIGLKEIRRLECLFLLSIPVFIAGLAGIGAIVRWGG